MLPPDPSGLGPEWQEDKRRKTPDDPRRIRFRDWSGSSLDWHPWKPGVPGWQGKDLRASAFSAVLHTLRQVPRTR